MLTQAIEDYLKTIYKLQHSDEPGGRVTTSVIASRMEVAAASATNMIKKLAEMNLLMYTPYRGVELTASGEKIALETIRHHRLIELYLSQALGYSWDQIDAEADRLEHAISEEFEDRIDEALGYPTVGAHGEPIPTKQGQIEHPKYRRLSELQDGQSAVIRRVSDRNPQISELQDGQSAVIRRVSDRNPQMLRYMENLHLLLGTRIEVTARAPFNGPLQLKVGAAKVSLGLEVAGSIFVEAD